MELRDLLVFILGYIVGAITIYYQMRRFLDE